MYRTLDLFVTLHREHNSGEEIISSQDISPQTYTLLEVTVEKANSKQHRTTSIAKVCAIW